MSIAWVRKYYGVPARRGGRVEYTGGKSPEIATIVSAQNGKLRIRFDGSDYTHPIPFHPTWELRYLDKSENAVATPARIGDQQT